MKTLLSHFAEQEIQTLVVIGAGAGADLLFLRGLNPHGLILVEAHPDLAMGLKKKIQSPNEETHWLAITDRNEDETLLHTFTDLKRCSLAPASALKKFAPNLRSGTDEQVPAKTFADFLKGLNLNSQDTNVLVLDTPGYTSRLIQSVPSNLLQVFDSLVLHGSEVPDLYANDISISETAAILEGYGFLIESNDSPECLYPYNAFLLRRDPVRIEILNLVGEKDELATLANDLQNQLDVVTKERDTQTKLASDRQNQLEAVTKERDRLSGENANLIKERDAQTKLSTDRQNQLEAVTKKRDSLSGERANLIKERDIQTKLATDRQTQLEAVTKERDKLSGENANLIKERDAQTKLSTDRQNQLAAITKERDTLKADKAALQHQLKTRNDSIADLEKKNAEMSHRQQLMQDELTKAEAQIELIKDLLLRESGL